jgi:hypothetical protein
MSFCWVRWATRIGVLCLLLVPACVSATAQIPDTIEVDGERMELFSQPLRQLEQANPRAWRKLARYRQGMQCSAAWFGVLASWKVQDERLYLAAVRASPCSEDSEEIPLRKLFGRRLGRAPVLADWVSGELFIPRGRLVEYVHAGFASQYERYLRLRVENGMVVMRELVEPSPAE